MTDNATQIQKALSLRMLAGGMAHRFNNLLTSVVGHTELALSQFSGKDRIRQDLAAALRDARRMAKLTESMQDYAGAAIAHLNKIDLNTIAERAAAKVDSGLPPGVYLHVEPSSGPAPILGESGILETMVVNLLVNAVEALNGSGDRVTVSCSISNLDEPPIDDHYLRSEQQLGHYACLKVSDTGYGMDEVTLKQIFDPFFSTKGAGRGLGLSEAQGIALAHGGGIAVETELGKGSSFRVFLPLPEDMAVQSTAVAQGRPAGAGILVMDDEPGVRRYTERILTRHGYTVFLAEDGASGVDLFRRHADEIDLVVLDMFMPRMNGDEALRQIRRIRPSITSIVSSGYMDSMIVERFAEEEPSAFVHKPFSAADLIGRIDKLLNKERAVG